MTTQIPYGPPGADYPQFASGHAQYPPAGYQHPVHSHHAAAPHHPVAPEAQIPHQQPPSPYPTAPPWATQSAAPEAPAAPAPAPPVQYEHATQVGGLLVPYPEEIKNAPRAQAPSVWPVAAFTFFFSLLGAVSASRRAGQARRGRNGAARYWITFVATAVVATVFWLTIWNAVVQPAVVQFRESATLEALEDNVLHDGQLAKGNFIATKADCQAAGKWVGGKRQYLCELTLSNGQTGRLLVYSDAAGNWKSVKGR